METNKGFISVSDYAKLRGVSVAAVYKRLGGSLKPYYKEIDGKKFLSFDVLEAEGIKPQEAQEHPGEEEQAGTPGSQDTTPAAFLVALEALERQLSEKDRQIQRLQDEAAELRQEAAAKDKFIQEQASRLTLLLEQSQELQRNNQILLGMSQGATPARREEAQEAPGEAQGAAPAETPTTQDETPAEEQAAPASPGGFWRRIFGGWKK